MQLERYIKQVQQIRNEFCNLTPVVECCDCILETMSAFRQHQLPFRSLPSLELNDDFVIDHLIEYPNVINISSQLEDFRQTVVENFGIWHVCSREWIDDLQQFCGVNAQNLELMAGNAIISANLPNTIATDNLNWDGQDNEKPRPWTKVERLDALTAVQKYYRQVDNIIMAWAPNNDDVDFQVLQFLRESHFRGNFIVIGEREGATNSSLFWKVARLKLPTNLNIHHQPFDFIKDRVWTVM